MITITLALKIILGMAVGFILYKAKIINDSANASMSRIIAEAICPFLIFSSIMSISGQEVISKSEVYLVLFIGVIIYVILPILAWLIVKLLRPPKRSEGVYQFFLIFGNVGFIGLPIAESLYGSAGVFFMALLNIHFNILCYSYGIWLMTRDLDSKHKFTPKKIINPAIVSIIIALTLFLLDIRLPEIVISPISFVGSITSPLSMIVLGASIAAQDIKKIFTQWRLYVVTFIKMIIFPLATFFILKAVIGPGTITNTLTLYMGTPAAVIAGMFAMAYGGDVQTATSGTAMTNIFFIVTIPLIHLLTTSV